MELNYKQLCHGYKIPLRHEMCTAVSFTEKYNMPLISPYNGPIPECIMSFNRVRASSCRKYVVHFFISDSFFECVWNSPVKYISLLKSLPAVISTDYSLYSDMLMPEIMWNTFRNKLLASWWQKNGVSVIPNVSWGKGWSLDMCLEGYPKHSVISINSTGLHQDCQAKRLWIEGYKKVIETLSPTHIIRYGAKQEGEDQSISTYFKNDNFKSSSHGW